jgi:hypothetical protein
MRDTRLLFHDDDETDPLVGIPNLFDASMVFAVALMVSIVSFMKMSDLWTQNNATIVKNPGKENMEIIRKEGKKITKYTASQEQSKGGKGRKIGIAYELEDGSVIYVPEDVK